MEELSPELQKNILTIDGERIIDYRRQHGIVLWPQLVITLTLGLIFLILLVVSSTLGAAPFLLVFTAFILTALGVGLYDYKSYSDWRQSLFIITNKKILITEVTDSKISHNREVIWEPVKETGIEVKFSGILGRRMNYGDVTVTFDTSSRIEPITFEKIPDPEGFRKSLEEAKYEQ